MKIMRRMVSILMIVCLVFGVTGCRKKKNQVDPANQNVVTEAAQSGTDSGSKTDANGKDNSAGKDDSALNPNGSANDGPVITTAPNEVANYATYSTLGTGSKTGSFELTGTKKVPADGIGTPGVDFEMIDEGEFSGWSAEEQNSIAAFLPLKDRSLYKDYKQYDKEYTRRTLEYLAADGFTTCTLDVYGLEYYLEFENSAATKNWILYLAKQKNATILNTLENRAMFWFIEDGYAWFVYVDISSRCKITEWRTKLITPGEELAVAGDGTDVRNGYYYFVMKNTPGKQMSATLRFDGTVEDIYDGLDIEDTAKFTVGSYYYRYRNQRELYRCNRTA